MAAEGWRYRQAGGVRYVLAGWGCYALALLLLPLFPFPLSLSICAAPPGQADGSRGGGILQPYGRRATASGWAGMRDGWRVGVIVWPWCWQVLAVGAPGGDAGSASGAGAGAGRASRPQKAFVNIAKYALAIFAILTYYFTVSKQQNLLTNSNIFDKIGYTRKRGTGWTAGKAEGFPFIR